MGPRLVSLINRFSLSVVLVSIPCIGFAASSYWRSVLWAEGQETPVDQYLSQAGLTCIARSYQEQAHKGLAVCRSSSVPELSIYELRGAPPSFELKPLRSLGDAYTARINEFHSPFMTNQTPRPGSKDSHVVYLVDVMDEGSCYGTEVLELKGQVLAYVGSIVESTSLFSQTFGVAGYQQSPACLGQFGRIEEQRAGAVLSFPVSGIERPDAQTGEAKKIQSRLFYRLSKGKLGRVEVQ